MQFTMQGSSAACAMAVARLAIGLLFLGALCAGCTGKERGADGEISGALFIEKFTDTSRRLSAQEAAAAEFKPLPGEILDEGFSSDVHWLKVRIPAQLGRGPQFIVFESLTLDRADLYSAENLKDPVFRAGDHYQRSIWAVPWSDYPTFAVLAGQTYLIRLETTSLLMMPVTVRTETNLRDFTERRTYLSALYAGFTLMLCLVALVIFLALRDFVYLLYAGYIASQTVAFAVLFSSFYRLLWPESPYIQNHLYFLAQAISLAFGTAFFRVFMDLAERRPRLNSVVMSVTVLSLIIAACTLFSTQNVLFSRSLTLIYLFWIPIFLAFTLHQIEPHRIDMWIFALVWGAVYIAGILYMLAAARIIPFHAFFFYGQTALFPFDAVFFVLSLYKRYRNIEASRVLLEREMMSTLAKLAQSRRVRPSKKGAYPRSKLSAVNLSKALEGLDQALRIQKVFKQEDLTLAELSGLIGVTPHQLSEICNAQLNTSFPKLLSYHRVQEARELLAKTDLNILELAFESGFASKSAFNIEFKRVTGMTPREYRARRGLELDSGIAISEAS